MTCAGSPEAFAIWITGLPASGKSTLARALKAMLEERGIVPAVLESDELRKIFTPHPRYDDPERDLFYRQMIWVGALLVRHGVPVIFDATANRRAWRHEARQSIPRFLEVFIDAPLELCQERDPKGIYRQAQEGAAAHVPGVQAAYEPSEQPDFVVDTACTADAAPQLLAALTELGWIPAAVAPPRR